jgi:hypothetical protein
MFSDAIVAIDGSKFKASNNKSNNYTPKKVQTEIDRVEKYISRYLTELDNSDDQEKETDTTPIDDKITWLKTRLAELHLLKDKVQEHPDKQISTIDPDSIPIHNRVQKLFVIILCHINEVGTMSLETKEVKAIIAAISNQEDANSLTWRVKTESLEDGTEIYFFMIKVGGKGSLMQAIGKAIGWAGNVAQGLAGAAIDMDMGVGSIISSASGNVAAAGGKVDAAITLHGAYDDGIIKDSTESDDEGENNNVMHQLKSAGGLQGIGWMSVNSSTFKLWSHPMRQDNWDQFIRMLDEPSKVVDSACQKGSIMPLKQQILIGKNAFSYSGEKPKKSVKWKAMQKKN